MQKKENYCSITCKGITVSWTPDLADLLKVAVFLNSLDMTNKQPDPSVIPPPYDNVEEGYKPAIRKEAVCDQWGHLKCTRCDKVVSTMIPANTCVRAFVECPECIEKDLKKEEQERKEQEKETWNLKCSRCKKIISSNVPKEIGTIRAYIECPECVRRKEEKRNFAKDMCFSHCLYIKCSRCGKIVSTQISMSIVIKAHIECPECIEREQNERDLDAYIDLRRKDLWTSF